MPLLPPRVGEIDVHGPEAGCRNKPGQDQPRRRRARPWRWPARCWPAARRRAAHTSARARSPGSCASGSDRRGVDQKQALARADLELDGMVVAEKCRPIDRRVGSAGGPGRSGRLRRRSQVESVTSCGVEDRDRARRCRLARFARVAQSAASSWPVMGTPMILP